MTHAYNCTQHDSTGYSPYFLMYGRHPGLPLDLVFGRTSSGGSSEYSDYVQDLQDCLKFAYAQANESSRQAKQQQKKHYDRQVKSHTFEPGDRVLFKVCAVEGRQKLGDRWKSKPYVVLKEQPGVPVYVIWSEDGMKEKVVHGNLLTQCMFFPMNTEQFVDETQKRNESANASESETEEGTSEKENGEDDNVRAQFEEMRQQDELEQLTVEKADSTSPAELEIVQKNPPRNRRPPKRLSFQLRAVEHEESTQQKIDRGRKIWQRAKARLSADSRG